MKTKQEIEKMKDGIEARIQSVQNQISDVCYCDYPDQSIQNLSDKKRQLMAQYNILLEVLK